MIGKRKVWLALFFGGLTMFITNEHQAYVLATLVIATMGANSVEHLAGSGLFKKVADEASAVRDRIRTVRTVSDPTKNVFGQDTNDH